MYIVCTISIWDCTYVLQCTTCEFLTFRGKDVLALAHTARGAEPLMTAPRGYRSRVPGAWATAWLQKGLGCPKIQKSGALWEIIFNLWYILNHIHLIYGLVIYHFIELYHIELYPYTSEIVFCDLCHASHDLSTLRTVSGIFEDDKGSTLSNVAPGRCSWSRRNEHSPW